MKYLATVLRAIAVTMAAVGCSLDPPGGATDVACVEPVWDIEVSRFLLRSPEDNAGSGAMILMTLQSRADFRTDVADGIDDFVPHQEVYHFDARAGTFAIVEHSEWDNAATPVQDCCPSLAEEGPLTLSNQQLLFGGQPVSVAGGTAVDLDDAPSSPIAAVLSTNGRIGMFSTTSGQNYHQPFSMETGRAVGPALRLPTGGLNNGRTFMGWSDDERFVLYRGSLESRPKAATGLGILCIVPVEQYLAELKRVGN